MPDPVVSLAPATVGGFLLQFGVEQFLPPSLEQYSDVVADIGQFLLVFVIVYLLARLLVVPGLLRIVRARNRNNRTLVTAVETYLSVLAVAVALLAGLAASGQVESLFDTDSAIIVAALTFAFGVAGQEVFGSLVSGLFLVADPDFNVGDWIVWSGGEGVVEAVDFRVTRIRTVDNETITVPNTELTTNALTRPFGRSRFRVVEVVYLPYDEETDRALLTLQQVAGTIDGVLDDPSPEARVEELSPDNVRVQTTFWVENPDRQTVERLRADFRRQVKHQFGEDGLTLAPPSGHELSGSVTLEEERPSSTTGSGPADD